MEIELLKSYSLCSGCLWCQLPGEVRAQLLCNYVDTQCGEEYCHPETVKIFCKYSDDIMWRAALPPCNHAMFLKAMSYIFGHAESIYFNKCDIRMYGFCILYPYFYLSSILQYSHNNPHVRYKVVEPQLRTWTQKNSSLNFKVPHWDQVAFTYLSIYNISVGVLLP